jgi:RecA-family ATPase
MRDRRLAWRHAHPGVGDLGYFLSIDDAPMLGSKQGDAADLIEFIRFKQGMPRLVIIDTLSKVLHGENENQEGMIAVMANADKIANAFDCVVMLVHHAKRGEDRGRGADQFGANSQGELTLKRRGRDMATILRVARLKGFSEGERILLRMSEPITLRRQEYGRPVTSLTIESAERAPERVEQDQCEVDPATGEVRPSTKAKGEKKPAMTATERKRRQRERTTETLTFTEG